MSYTNVVGRVIEYLSGVDPIVVEVATTVLLVIAAGISVFFAGKKLSIMVREKERDMILEMVKNLVIPVKNALNPNMPLKPFPVFLNFVFCIPPHILKGAIFDRFAKRNRLLKWNILRYQKLCLEFKKKIEKLKKEAEDKEVIKSVIGRSGSEILIDDQYDGADVTKVLAEKGLDEKIENIKEFRDQQGLDKKAKKLIHKLEKLISDYQDKYHLTDEELGIPHRIVK